MKSVYSLLLLCEFVVGFFVYVKSFDFGFEESQTPSLLALFVKTSDYLLRQEAFFFSIWKAANNLQGLAVDMSAFDSVISSWRTPVELDAIPSLKFLAVIKDPE